jgi:hypothetical protein
MHVPCRACFQVMVCLWLSQQATGIHPELVDLAGPHSASGDTQRILCRRRECARQERRGGAGDGAHASSTCVSACHFLPGTIHLIAALGEENNGAATKALGVMGNGLHEAGVSCRVGLRERLESLLGTRERCASALG